MPGREAFARHTEVPLPAAAVPSGRPADPNAKPGGWRQVLTEKGPEGYAQAVRAHKGLLLTDTTWRDAHQSLLATRMRTAELLRCSSATADALSSAFSLEMWGSVENNAEITLAEITGAALASIRRGWT
jgi:pyruvate carboxylase